MMEGWRERLSELSQNFIIIIVSVVVMVMGVLSIMACLTWKKCHAYRRYEPAQAQPLKKRVVIMQKNTLYTGKYSVS